jgi:GT2 family glycosyltransferase
MSTSNALELSVIIVSWNTRDLLKGCLASLRRELAAIAHEIIVVDNNSSDDTVGMVRAAFPETVVIHNSVNRGVPRANNQALARCRGRFVLLLNPDTLVEPEAIARMLDRMTRNNHFGAAGCRLVHPDGSLQFECGRNFPTLWNVAFELLGLSRVFPGNRLTGHWRMTYWDHLDDREVPCILGACMLVRREVFAALGGLDEHTYLEDIDLCYRIGRAGWKILFVGSAVIVHYGGASTGRAADAASYRHYQVAWRALWLFFRKHRGRATANAFAAMLFTITSAGILGLGCWSLVASRSSTAKSARLRKAAAVWKSSVGMLSLPEGP